MVRCRRSTLPHRACACVDILYMIKQARINDKSDKVVNLNRSRKSGIASSH